MSCVGELFGVNQRVRSKARFHLLTVTTSQLSVSVPPAPSSDIAALSDAEILDEYRDNLYQIVRLASDAQFPESITHWDKVMAGASAAISIAGIAAAPVTAGLSLWLTVAGIGISAVDLERRNWISSEANALACCRKPIRLAIESWRE